MNTELDTKIKDFLQEVESIRELYKIMMDCISYHVSAGNGSGNIFPLASIIEDKLNNLETASDNIFLVIHNK